jgi:hypothetical protein
MKEKTAITAAFGKYGTSAALRRAGLFVCLLLLVSAAGCASKLYNVDMRYQPAKVIKPAVTDGRRFSLTVASFIDNRKMEDTLLLGRVLQSDGSSIPVLPKFTKATDAVAEALRDLLIQLGYDVSLERTVWDLQENTIRPDWGTILVGGAIEELDVACVDTFPKKHYTAKIRVALVFADVNKRRIFYRVTTESSSTLDHVIFSEGKLESQINGVLSEAMEKAVEGPEMGRRIRESLSQ